MTVSTASRGAFFMKLNNCPRKAKMAVCGDYAGVGEVMMGKRVKWWLGLLLVIGGVWFSAARPVAASSDVDAVVQRTGERNHYQLQVANLKNQTLRDLNIKVRFSGPKVKRGTVMTWHVAKLGATPRTSVPFTVSRNGTVTAGKAGVAVSRTGHWPLFFFGALVIWGGESAWAGGLLSNFYLPAP